MDPGRWREIERLFHAAAGRPAEARAAFLAEAGAGDEGCAWNWVEELKQLLPSN